MCDGSHKTTALTLTHNKIHCIVLKSDKDMERMRALVKTGEIFSMSTKKTIRAELTEKANHLKGANFFESVKDKTDRMADEKVIPEFMIKEYRKGK